MKKNGQRPYQLVLPNQGAQAEFQIKSLKKNLQKRTTKQQRKPVYFRRHTKLGFIIKDKTKFEHQHNLIYFGSCPENNFTDNYIGEIAREISERIVFNKELRRSLNVEEKSTVFELFNSVMLDIHSTYIVAVRV